MHDISEAPVYYGWEKGTKLKKIEKHEEDPWLDEIELERNIMNNTQL